jgi:hypothetical protein
MRLANMKERVLSIHWWAPETVWKVMVGKKRNLCMCQESYCVLTQNKTALADEF